LVALPFGLVSGMVGLSKRDDSTINRLPGSRYDMRHNLARSE